MVFFGEGSCKFAIVKLQDQCTPLEVKYFAVVINNTVWVCAFDLKHTARIPCGLLIVLTIGKQRVRAGQ